MLDDFDFEEFDDSGGDDDFGGADAGLPEESNNRTFLFVAGGLGAIMVIALIIMAVYALVILPNRQTGGAADGGANATIEAQNQQIADSLTQTAEALSFTPTASNTPTEAPPTDTPLPSDTPAQDDPQGGATDLPADTTPTEEGGVGGGAGPTVDPRTATVEALLTQAAVAQTQAASSILTVTPTPTSVSNLPDTGFIDDVGAPALVGMAALLVVVIFAARRLREANM